MLGFLGGKRERKKEKKKGCRLCIEGLMSTCVVQEEKKVETN